MVRVYGELVNYYGIYSFFGIFCRLVVDLGDVERRFKLSIFVD
jgi:hypothetical protein